MLNMEHKSFTGFVVAKVIWPANEQDFAQIIEVAVFAEINTLETTFF